ncbi:MAG: peptide deformylase [Candidatus Saccharimonadales bacterium]|jgi:peptide deformylase
MATKDIIISLPDSRLRGKSRRVGLITDEIRQIIKDMTSATLDWEASREHELGVALAAIQIDKPYRIVIVRNNFEDKNDHSFSVLINPEITKLEGQVEEDFEGCLSVPDIYGKVPRYSQIRIRALNENGQRIRVRAEGFLARILQHEVDHCSGKMFVDLIKGKPGAFYKLTDSGKLAKLDYAKVEKTHIFSD